MTKIVASTHIVLSDVQLLGADIVAKTLVSHIVTAVRFLPSICYR